jgi:hypothetical protein
MHWTRCKNNSWLDLHGIGDQCNQHSALSSTAKSYACNQNTLTNRRPSICPNSRNQSQSNCWEGPLEAVLLKELHVIWMGFVVLKQLLGGPSRSLLLTMPHS